MLDINIIKENKDRVIAALEVKNHTTAKEDITRILELDEQRRNFQQELDEVLSTSKKMAKSIGQLMKEGKKDEAEAAKAETGALKTKGNELREAMKSAEDDLHNALAQVPNTPHPDVPRGAGEEDNQCIFQQEINVSLPENPLPHWELIKKYNIIDFELGNKVSGAGFPFYIGKGARLQRALISFFLDEAQKAGYTEVQPPILINEDSGFGTGQLPDKDGQMYHMAEDNLYVIPTAEVPITNMFRDVILKEEELPQKMAGYSPCFRREAGSWGAHVRGLNRLHQFDKVEIVQVQHPDHSYKALEEMSEHVQGLLKKLELPYRVMVLCGGDISLTAALTHDMEVYSAAQQRWLEVSSISNFESYQSTRLKLRYKDKDKKSQWLHTLNASALALPRILAALLENNQTADGIIIPEVLRPYTGFDKID